MTDAAKPVDDLTPVEKAAAIVRQTWRTDYVGLTVPRSHRFRLVNHDRILALAEAAAVPFSVMLEEVIESGLHAVEQVLGDDYLAGINYRVLRSCEVAMKGRKRASLAVIKSGGS